MITYGSLFSFFTSKGFDPVSLSSSRFSISSFNILLSSSVPRTLSRFTLASIFSIIFNVVSTPTSEVINISSRLSRTSSSTRDFPTTALAILPKKESLVFSRPLSRFSFFCFEKKSKIPIAIKNKSFPWKLYNFKNIFQLAFVKPLLNFRIVYDFFFKRV